jgi:type I restriction enzyme M protein
MADKSLTDLDNLPDPDELAEEIIENLEAGLNSFRQVLSALNQALKNEVPEGSAKGVVGA